MNVFWERGFEATSMNDLVLATGMAKPGLYAAFGDKEQLFCSALTRYYERSGRLLLDDLMRSPDTLSAAVRRYLEAIADAQLDKTKPDGCFIANSVVECAHHPSPLADLARVFDGKRREALLDRFQRAKLDDEIPKETEIDALADFFSGQALAMAVMGRAGADRATFKRFIDVAMKAIPARQGAYS